MGYKQNTQIYYNQNKALLFQLFLHECLQTTQLLRRHPNADHLHALIGDLPQENLSYYFCRRWCFRLGHLQKLRYYHMLLNSHTESQYKKMGQILDQTWTSALQALHGRDVKTDKQLFDSLKQRIKRIAKLFIEKVSNYQNDENILFFLVCRFEELDELYGEPTITKILTSFFKGNIQTMRGFLSDKYLQRGFNHLLPIIHKRVRTLQKYV